MNNSIVCSSENNRVSLVGILSTTFEKNYGDNREGFMRAILKVRRFSGVYDSITLIAHKHDLEGLELKVGTTVEIEGVLKTYYKPSKYKTVRTYVFVNAINILPADVPHQNQVWLRARFSGYHKIELRFSPFGRQILDFTLSQAQENNSKYTYNVPCIAWNSDARSLAKVSPGSILVIQGRLQSRIYKKVCPGMQPFSILTHEISISEVLEVI